MNIERLIKDAIKRTIYRPWDAVAFDNTYAWLGYAFQELMKDELCARKPHYLWGVLQGAALGKVLGMASVSAIELGVGGGGGLLSLERIAERVGSMAGIDVDVLGFDTGVGLPKPEDYRDQPNMWFEGQLPMDQEALERQLKRASLRLGPVKETVPRFMAEEPAPVAFIAFDLDLYTSTRDACEILLAPYARLLPRVFAYFDDIMGHTYNDFAGERLAISEFNQNNAMRKFSPLYGLKSFVPRRFANINWDCMYIAHLFEHPQYCTLDSRAKAVYTDERGIDLRTRVDSDWRSLVPGNLDGRKQPAAHGDARSTPSVRGTAARTRLRGGGAH